MKLSARSPRKTLLKKRIKALEATARECKRKLETEVTLEDVVKFLEQNYSERACQLLKTQISLLNRASKGSRYTDEFKQFALSVYFLGPKAYKKMSTVCRLPSKCTLQRFTKRWIVNPGFNEFIFRVTECRVKLLKEKEKDCILCLDEISLKSHVFYDISKDKIIGFDTTSSKNNTEIAGSALTIMARGIASSWKQPIAYFFCKTAATSDDLKDILFEAVRKLRGTGLNVLGVVSDQGSNFYKLVKTTLKLTEDNPLFFVDDIKLVYLFDIPHLLKSTRNNFFSYIFLLDEGETRKIYLETMYNLDKTKQFRLTPKLSNEHIYPNNFQKMKVKLATQVFSHSVAVAMHTYINFNVIPKEATTTANFIKKMNDLFDLLNSSTLQNFQAFMGTEKQKQNLQEMDNLFKNLKVFNHLGKDVTHQLKFIFGWRMTIKSVGILWEILQAKGYKYLFTRNLNQDCIENFFGHIRNCCGNTRNPTPIQFCRAFKKIFAQKYFDQAYGANCIDDVNEVLLNLTPEYTKTCEEFVSIPTPTYTPLKVFTNDYSNLNCPEGNALVYVTGYLLKKSLIQHSCDVCVNFALNSNTLLSEDTIFSKLKAFNTAQKTPFGGLTIPSKDIVDYVIALENIFIQKFNEIAGQEAIGTQLKNEFGKISFIHPCKEFPFNYFISLYTRVRIYFTLKFVNSDIKQKLHKGNLKLSILKNL